MNHGSDHRHNSRDVKDNLLKVPTLVPQARRFEQRLVQDPQGVEMVVASLFHKVQTIFLDSDHEGPLAAVAPGTCSEKVDGPMVEASHLPWPDNGAGR